MNAINFLSKRLRNFYGLAKFESFFLLNPFASNSHPRSSSKMPQFDKIWQLFDKGAINYISIFPDIYIKLPQEHGSFDLGHNGNQHPDCYSQDINGSFMLGTISFGFGIMPVLFL